MSILGIRSGLLISVFCTVVIATPYYYGTYRTYGTGDTVIAVSHANGGPKDAFHKWQVECLDGEAIVALLDLVFDFGGIVNVWCRFMFPYKPSTTGVYPYFPICHVRNYRNEFFCYDPGNHTVTANTFMTGLWDDDYTFWIYRKKVDDEQLYKCCKVPKGYYIDYVSCYYLLSHDQYWEYYDSQFFLLMCATGYVYTGISKKISPINGEYRLEWVQCCRVGYGEVVPHQPPIIATPNGGPVAYSSQQAIAPDGIPTDYQHQYRGKRSAALSNVIHTNKHSVISAEMALPGDGPVAKTAVLDHFKLAPGSPWKPELRETLGPQFRTQNM